MNKDYIIASGEAILSAENSGKPLGGRGSAPSPAGELALPDPVAGDEGVAAPPQVPCPRSGPSVLRSWPNEKSLRRRWTGPSEKHAKHRNLKIESAPVRAVRVSM